VRQSIMLHPEARRITLVPRVGRLCCATFFAWLSLTLAAGAQVPPTPQPTFVRKVLAANAAGQDLYEITMAAPPSPGTTPSWTFEVDPLPPSTQGSWECHGALGSLKDGAGNPLPARVGNSSSPGGETVTPPTFAVCRGEWIATTSVTPEGVGLLNPLRAFLKSSAPDPAGLYRLCAPDTTPTNSLLPPPPDRRVWPQSTPVSVIGGSCPSADWRHTLGTLDAIERYYDDRLAGLLQEVTTRHTALVFEEARLKRRLLALEVEVDALRQSLIQARTRNTNGGQ
jgi:hypothetical protein